MSQTEPVSPGSAADHPNSMAGVIDLGQLAKVATGVGAFAYAAGAVAINTFLHQLGIADFSFAKPKLLLTGMLVLFTMVLLAAPVFALLLRLAARREPGQHALAPLGEIVAWVAGTAVLLVLASFGLCFHRGVGLGQITVWWTLQTLNLHSAVTASLLIAAEVYAATGLAAYFAFRATRLYLLSRSEKRISYVSRVRFHFVVATAFAIVFAIGYIILFAFTFYPTIPQAFGGGEPYFQSFVIADENRCQLQQLGIPFDKNLANVTEPLPVLHESDVLVAVWLRMHTPSDGTKNIRNRSRDNFVVMQIDKKQINAMRIYPPPAMSRIPSLVTAPEPCPVAGTSSK